jgi:hypothetical protein
MADEPLVIAPPTPVAQEAKTEEVPVREPDIAVSDEQVPAQVSPEREAADDTVREHETHVTVDEVITDPNDPLAVQVPPEGRGNAVTPIAAAYHNGRTPEEVFAAAAADEKPADSEPSSDENPSE